LAVYGKRREDLVGALTDELGVPTKFARDIQVGAGFLHLNAGIAALENFQFEYPIGKRTIVLREPIGVVGMITPWNWPITRAW
jgi:acyl-CoA reductase-like NAD-dependent aldehyde dehydrogenase